MKIVKRISILLLPVALALVAGCEPARPLEIDVVQKKGGAREVRVLNNTDQKISYLTTLLDHPSDMWYLHFRMGEGRKDIGAFIVFMIDKDGERHLVCGLKDLPPPGILPVFGRLNAGESATFRLEDPSLYTSCMKGRETDSRWQVMYIKTLAGDGTNLNNPSDYSVIYESNLVEVR